MMDHERRRLKSDRQDWEMFESVSTKLFLRDFHSGHHETLVSRTVDVEVLHCSPRKARNVTMDARWHYYHLTQAKEVRDME